MMDMEAATVVTSERLVNPKIVPCPRCKAKGRVPFARAGGRCFRCGGSGYLRDRQQVVKEVRCTLLLPTNSPLEIKVGAAAPQESAPVVVPTQEEMHSGGGTLASSPNEAPRSSCEPHLVGLSWTEQARLRALQRDGA